MWWDRRQRQNRVPLFNKHVDYMMSVTAPAKPEPLTRRVVTKRCETPFTIYFYPKPGSQ